MKDRPDEVVPIGLGERIVALDIVRGLALFGVLQINLIFMSGNSYQQWAGVTYPLGWGGSVLTWAQENLINGKAVACFSMLFGVGVCIQMERISEKGYAYGLFAMRRLGALAVIGVAHSTLIWNGDILLVYAVAALALLPFLRAKVRTILFALSAAFLLELNHGTILHWLRAPDELFFFGHWKKQAAWLLQSATQAYGQSNWTEATRWRVWEWNHSIRAIELIGLFGVLPPFLLGLALWRSGILKDPTGRVQTIRRVFHSVFWLGLAISIIPSSWLELIHGAWWVGWRGMLMRGVLVDAPPRLLALGYFMGILMLLQREWWVKRLVLFAPLGRMALTNYLAQSLVCTWFFNGYGLGFWTRVTPSAYFLGGMALYGVQIAFSYWWLARFKFGPMEWLWRSMTYGSLQPFLVQRERVPIRQEL